MDLDCKKINRDWLNTTRFRRWESKGNVNRRWRRKDLDIILPDQQGVSNEREESASDSEEELRGEEEKKRTTKEKEMF